MLALLNNRLTQIGIAVIIASGLAFAIGWDKGGSHEREKSLAGANAKIIANKLVSDRVLAQRESEIVDLTKKNTNLLAKVKQNENIINRTNHITTRFVRLSSGDSMPEASSTAIEANAASDDDAAISSPTRVVQYNLLLKQAYDQCRIDYNALVATWQ